MRIIVNGQQAFGRAVLMALLDHGEDVVGVYTAPDREGRPPDPLKACAVERGIPVFQPESFEPAEVFEQMEELAPNLAVMTPDLGVTTPFVPEHVLCLPTHGTIQYHPSLLPMHKGPSCVNWPIIYGEKKTGLSIFWPDGGNYTGPVLFQKEVEIEPDDTLGSLYSDRLFPMGVEAMVEAVDLVREGKAPAISQRELFDEDPGVLRTMVHAWAGSMRKSGLSHMDLPEICWGDEDEVFLEKETMYDIWAQEVPDYLDRGPFVPDQVLGAVVTIGTREDWCRSEDVEINWHRHAGDVYNLIRGANPRPGAWTRFAGKKLQIYDCRAHIHDAPLFEGNYIYSAEEMRVRAGYYPIPGQVASVNAESFCVWATGDDTIEVLQVRPEGGARMNAGEFAASVGLKADDSLD